MYCDQTPTAGPLYRAEFRMSTNTARKIRHAARDGRAARRCAARAGLPLETQLGLGRLAARMATLPMRRRDIYCMAADIVDACVMIRDAEDAA